MKILSVDGAVKKIDEYMGRSNFCPYFVVADGSNECKTFKKIFENTFGTIYVSDFCGDDFPLDSDLFVEHLNNLDKNSVCFGLGEYIFLTGQENVLRSLQDKTFNKKIIFICRGISNLLERLADEDPKFQASRICRVQGNLNVSVVKYSPNIAADTVAKNFTELLKLLEGGAEHIITATSALPILNAQEINSFYDAVKIRDPHLAASSTALNESQWQDFWTNENCAGYPPEHWRTFAAGFKNKISDPYLKFVFSNSANYEEYKKNLIFALLDVDEKILTEFYKLRKSAIKNFSATYLDEYLKRLTKLKKFPIAKFLTDNTEAERRAMIESIQGEQEIPESLLENYPAIKSYLLEFDFGDAEITKYFQRYKQIKICNVADENFRQQVEKFAISRPYNKFLTRRAILEKLNELNGNLKLYWLDALGVEFLNFIKCTATNLKMKIKIFVGRADLPSVTSYNRSFYDEWSNDKFEKNSKLDELKHSSEKFDASGKCSAPTYICDELKIISEALEGIKTWLTNHCTKKILLTSDHGASRAAVMFSDKVTHKMKNVGEYSGRCCLTSATDQRPDCAVEENNYWCLTNYDRFAGGRLGSVEVHGGATLEEILVPIILFSD